MPDPISTRSESLEGHIVRFDRNRQGVIGVRGLTIKQPYARLIAIGEKLVENRTWETRYRGRLAIHAGKGRDMLGDPDNRWREDELEFGCIVATCELVQCISIDLIRDGHLSTRFSWVKDHPHAHGPWCWVLADVKKLTKPIMVRGDQGLWPIDASTACKLEWRSPDYKVSP